MNFKGSDTKRGVVGGSPGLVVLGGDFLKVVGSNPGTVCWMDIFSHIKIVMMFV